ncbi:MAG: Asp23/Gls24 family envelope stress response protein [Thermoanaerobacterium sp.]|nr:Asp23/Gls24 family envelope stress response protein [Thermoanaerobacterium sp.]
MEQTKNNLGKIDISVDVIASMASYATSECYGIVGLGKRGPDGLIELFKNEQSGKGIKVTYDEDGIVIDLYIVVEYGVNIKTVAANIIEKIKYTIETYTGVNVKNIIVNVQSIKVDF